MKENKEKGSYCLLLLIGLVLALAGVDIARHTLAGSSAVPPHAHVTLEQLAIMGFCLLLYISGRLGLVHLNLRLCLLSLFLVVVKLAYELRAGRWENGMLFDLALFVLLVPLIISLASYPVRILSAERGQDAS
jgi:hypothetical protein